jgi:mono/diheme cytochrome c family protein
MKNIKQIILFLLFVFICTVNGCNRQPEGASTIKASSFATALVEVSGSKQIADSGVVLESPIIVQANDSKGNALAGALVTMHGPHGFVFDPSSGLTDSSGQFTSSVHAGPEAGKFQMTATTTDPSGKNLEVNMDVVVLGYQQTVGSRLNQQYCSRCHDSESTPERVSNYDNLTTKPHVFTDSQALNNIKDADLMAAIIHGGPGIGKSAEMPAYGKTLKKSDMEALIAYIRTVSETRYTVSGAEHAKE